VDTPLSDAAIAALLAVRKAPSSTIEERDKKKYFECNFPLRSADGTRFVLFTRQSRELADDFTAGLRVEYANGETLMLVRYNGSSHRHINHIENTRFMGSYHIHVASERYMAAGLDDEGYAEPTQRYSTLRQALELVIADCNIVGVRLPPEQLSLA
jgi:hypothetical protein